jgi:endo-1,4-beta-xylanase
LTFQWSKNGTVADGQADSRLRIGNPSIQQDGTRYRVVVSNPKGSVESLEAVLRVKPFSGPFIPFAGRPPEIDGRIDSVWTSAGDLPINRVILGDRKSEADCSGSFRMLWDEKGLFFLVRVKDDLKSDKNGQGYERDGIEIYIDTDNDKPEFYGDDEFQFRYNWHESSVVAAGGSAGPGIRAEQTDTQDGYCMEAVFPWKAVGGKRGAGEYVGIDVHVNDNDAEGRECKIAWKARRDISHQDPSSFGTVVLARQKK